MGQGNSWLTSVSVIRRILRAGRVGADEVPLDQQVDPPGPDNPRSNPARDDVAIGGGRPSDRGGAGFPMTPNSPGGWLIVPVTSVPM